MRPREVDGGEIAGISNKILPDIWQCPRAGKTGETPGVIQRSTLRNEQERCPASLGVNMRRLPVAAGLLRPTLAGAAAGHSISWWSVNTSTELCPPNPNELLMATDTFFFTDSLGV